MWNGDSSNAAKAARMRDSGSASAAPESAITASDLSHSGLLASAPRREIVQLLDRLPYAPTSDEPYTRERGLTAAHLANQLGRHVTTIRFHLDQLVAGGLVEYHDERSGVGRPSRYYRVTKATKVGADRLDAYRVTAKLLLEMVETGGTPDAVAANWVNREADSLLPEGVGHSQAASPGQWLAKVGPVVDLLQSWGFEPAITSTDAGHTADMTLGTCPIPDLASSRPSVVCALHRGIIRETLRSLGEEDPDVQMHVTNEGVNCRVTMTTSTNFPAYERYRV